MSASDKNRHSLAFFVEVHIGLPFCLSEAEGSFPMRTKETEALETSVTSGLIARRRAILNRGPETPVPTTTSS